MTSVPRSLEYGSIDHRQFKRVGLDVLTERGELVMVEHNKADTLVWVEKNQEGIFAFAFLRKGNAIYVLGKQGPYIMGNAVQTATYDLLMQAWRRAQLHTKESVAVQMPNVVDPFED